VPGTAPAEPADPDPTTAATLAAAVRQAVDAAEQDLAPMPFFIRPIVKGKFKDRTGLSFDDWRKQLAALRPDDTPASVRARWPQAQAALTRLVADFQGAPERARKGMGDEPERLRRVEQDAKVRAAAAQALLDWLAR
jgi:hypothetical protein